MHITSNKSPHSISMHIRSNGILPPQNLFRRKGRRLQQTLQHDLGVIFLHNLQTNEITRSLLNTLTISRINTVLSYDPDNIITQQILTSNLTIKIRRRSDDHHPRLTFNTILRINSQTTISQLGHSYKGTTTKPHPLSPILRQTDKERPTTCPLNLTKLHDRPSIEY